MRKVIIDTNGYLRFFLEDIPSQALQVEKLFRLAKTGEIEITLPLIIIFELHFALLKIYRKDKQEIIEKISSLLSSSGINAESADLLSATLKMYKRVSNLSFPDCFIKTQAEVENAELFTFDKNLAKTLN